MKLFSIYRISALSIVGALVLVGFFAKRGWVDLRQMALHNQSLDAQMKVAKAQKQALETAVYGLSKSPLVQRLAVQRHLGYVQARDFVIEFE